MLPWAKYPHFAASLLAILTPFIAVPAYLSLTQGFTTWERSRSAVLAAGTAAAVLVIAALIGPIVLGTLGDFCGIVAGWRRSGTPTDGALDVEPRRRTGPASSRDTSSGAIVPLGVPLLAGRSVSISSVMVEMRHGTGIFHTAAVILCVLTTCATVWTVLRFAQPIGDRIGRTGFDILSRVFGLLLAAMTVKIIACVLRSLFPALG